MKDELIGFDILDGKLYGLHGGEKGVLVYNIKQKPHVKMDKNP